MKKARKEKEDIFVPDRDPNSKALFRRLTKEEIQDRERKEKEKSGE